MGRGLSILAAAASYPKAPLLDLPNSYICIKIRLSSLSFIVPVRSRVEVRNISLPALTKTNLLVPAIEVRAVCVGRQAADLKEGGRKTTSEYQILDYHMVQIRKQ